MTGNYFNDLAEAHYFQIGNKVVIMNGSDPLSYLDINSAVVVPFTALTTPAAPTLSSDGTGGSGFPITYRVTWNSTVGETDASAVLSVDTAKDRDTWSGSDNVVLNLPTIVGSVQSVNVYAGVVAGSEYLIASGISPSTTTFTDAGGTAMPQDFTRKFPVNNSTSGPKVSRGSNIGGRAFLVGDKDNPFYVWWGGDPTFELDFTPANGGGNVPVGNGSKDLPTVVKGFRDGKGTSQVTVLCQGTNGDGKRFILTPDQATIGSTILSFYDVTEDNSQDGTDSPDGVIAYGTDLHYPSRDGFKTTGTLPQIQNVLSTRRTSNTIQDSLKNLNNSAMNGCVGLAFEGRLYWALPVNSSTNNEIWVLDLDRKGAWMKPWSIPADWMLLYNDNTGNTHHLILSDNQIYDLSYSALTTDDGIPFQTNGQSGEIYFSDDKRMWAQLLQVVIVLAAPQGQMNWQITGKTEDSNLQALGDPTVFTADTNTSVAGWGEVNPGIIGWAENAWSEVSLIPTDSSSATQELVIEVDEEVQWASYSWTTTSAGVRYGVSDVILEYVETGVKDLS